MTPEEWRKGMENEAASVDDVAWVRETRRAAAQSQRNGLWLDVLLNIAALILIPLIFWAYWTAMVNCRFGIEASPLNCWANSHPEAIDGLTLLLLVSVPFVLGLLRVRLNAILLTFALVPVAKILWPAVMPMLNLQPDMQSVALPPLNMLDYVHFTWFTAFQILASPMLAWLGWSVGRKTHARVVRA